MKQSPFLDFVTWLTSAWLTDAQRSKTFLEKLLKPYNAVPIDASFHFWQHCGISLPAESRDMALHQNFQGVGIGLIEILQQIKLKVKRAGTCVAKHQLHVLSG